MLEDQIQVLCFRLRCALPLCDPFRRNCGYRRDEVEGATILSLGPAPPLAAVLSYSRQLMPRPGREILPSFGESQRRILDFGFDVRGEQLLCVPYRKVLSLR